MNVEGYVWTAEASVQSTISNVFLMWVCFPLRVLMQNWRDLWQSHKSEPCVSRLCWPSSTSTRTTSFTETWKQATSCSHSRATSSWVSGKALRHSVHVCRVSRQEKTSDCESNNVSRQLLLCSRCSTVISFCWRSIKAAAKVLTYFSFPCLVFHVLKVTGVFKV